MWQPMNEAAQGSLQTVTRRGESSSVWVGPVSRVIKAEVL